MDMVDGDGPYHELRASVSSSVHDEFMSYNDEDVITGDLSSINIRVEGEGSAFVTDSGDVEVQAAITGDQLLLNVIPQTGWSVAQTVSAQADIDEDGRFTMPNEDMYITVTLVQTLTITKQPEDQWAASGSPVSFEVQAEGYQLTYQWYVRKNNSNKWVLIDSANQPIFSLTMSESLKDAQYRCVVSDGLGNTAVSDAATLHLSVAPITGDTAHPVLYALLALLSAALLFRVYNCNKKRS